MEALALNEFFFLFRKVSEPWELADGCVHLVGEIATIKVGFFSLYYPHSPCPPP